MLCWVNVSTICNGICSREGLIIISIHLDYFEDLQTGKIGDIGTAWGLQLSSPVLRAPNEDENTFLFLCGPRAPGLDLLGPTTRLGVDTCGGGVVVAAFSSISNGEGVSTGTCCAAENSVLLPLNSNPFLIFLVISTSGHARRILLFILSSANGCKESRVAVEYT